ncbi:cell surface protein [Eubacterium limosum]|nr:cell surface protein [Eubacterium limosum]
MNPTVKTTLTKTLILVFFALTAFFVLPGGVSAEEKAVGAFTVTGDSSGYAYDIDTRTLTVNNGADVTIKNTVPETPTEDKIVVAGDASITLDGVNIKVNKQNAIDLQSGTANIILKGDNTLVTTEENGGYSKAALRVAEQAALVLDEGDTKGSLDVKVDSSGWSGAAIGSDCGDGGNRVTIKTAGAITINGGTIVATTVGKQKGAAIGGGVYGNASKITINGGHVKATVLGNSGESQHAGAGIGSGALGNNAGDITITGGLVSAEGGKSYHPSTGNSAGAGIGGGSGCAGGNVVITGGTVHAVKGRDGAEDIGKGTGNGNSGSLTNGIEKVSLVTLTLSGDSVKNQAIDTLEIGGYTGADTSSAENKQYGIAEMTTDDEGKLYLYLPDDDPAAGSSANVALPNDKTKTLYRGEIAESGSSRKADLEAFSIAVDMSTIGGNLYIWNDGFMYGTSADEAAKIPYNGNYTLTGTTTANGVAVMPGYDGKTDGQDGYKTITLDGLNIDVSDHQGSCAFNLRKKNSTTPGAIVNLLVAANSDNNLKSGKHQAGIHVPESVSLTIDGSGKLTATSGEGSAGIGGDYESIEVDATSSSGNVTINGGSVTATGSEGGAGIGGGYAFSGFSDAISTNGAVTINGGTVTAMGSEGGAGIGGGHADADVGTASSSSGMVTITGGTVTANAGFDSAGIGGGSAASTYITGNTSSSGGDVIITGGSVKATGGGNNASNIGAGNAANKTPGTLKNGTGDDAKDIYLTTIQTAGISQATDVYPAGTPASYGLKDVQTDSAGKLYFYLPANDTSAPEAYTTVSLKKGSQNGALATGDLWVADNHGNTLQIGNEDTEAAFDANALTYNKTAQTPALKRGETTLAPSARYYKDASDNWSDKNTNVNATGYSVIAQTPADINSVYGQKIVKTDYNINPAAPVVTWPTASLTYGQTLSQASLTGGSAKGVGGADLLPGEFVWENPDTNPAVADSGITSYTLKFNPTDSTNYSSAQKADMTVSVNKANGTASVTMASWEYGQTPSDPVPVSATNGTENVSYQYKESTADDTTYTSTKPTMPGHYTVRATFGATTNYNTVTATADFTIREGSYTGLTFENKTIPYDGKPHSLTVAGTLPQGTTVTYAPQSVTDAGSHTITATISGAGYIEKSMTATLTIEAATPAVTITPAAGQEILIGEPVTLKVAVAGISGETVTGKVTLNGETQALENGHAAFSYTPADHQAKTLTADYTPESKSNYTAASTSITLTAGKKTREPITLSDQTKTYGDPAYTLTPTGGSLQDGEAYSYTSDNTGVAEVDINGQVTIAGAGAAHLTVSLPESSAYQSAQTVMTLTVEKAAITSVTFEDASFKADGQPHSIELTGELPQGATVAYENNTQTTPGIYKAKAMIDGGQNYQSLTLEATLTITEKPVNPYMPEKPETPDEVSDSIDKLPTPEDYDAMTPEEQEEVKDAVDTVVDSITDLPEEEQAQIPAEDIEKISDLYDKIYKITIHKDTSAAQGLPTHVDEADIQVYGAGMAAQALGGDVKITLTQDLPPDHATLAFTLELYVKRESGTDYQKVDLKTPIVIQFALPESVKADGLTIEHLNPDGSVKETLTPEIKERTLTFLTTSFSNFLFVEQKDPTPPTPTPTPTTTVKPEGNGGETRAESVLKKETSLKNPATGQAVTVGQLGGTAAVLAALAVLTALAIGRKSKKH